METTEKKKSGCGRLRTIQRRQNSRTNEALHLIYHIALWSWSLTGNSGFLNAIQALILIYKALASGSWLPWKWNSFLDTFLHATNCSEMPGSQRHFCASPDVKKKKKVQYKELPNFNHYCSRDREISNKDKYTEGAQMHGLAHWIYWLYLVKNKKYSHWGGQGTWFPNGKSLSLNRTLDARKPTGKHDVWTFVCSLIFSHRDGEVGGEKMTLRRMLWQVGTGRVNAWCWCVWRQAVCLGNATPPLF